MLLRAILQYEIIVMKEQIIKLRADLENCFSRHQANKFHCKSISWFRLRAYSNMAKNFLCGIDAALIAEVLIRPLFSIHAKLEIQNHLLVHLTLSGSLSMCKV